MKLTIVVVNYNTKGLTLACLKSLERFPAADKFEIILVDNGSTDGLVKELSALNPKFKNYALRVIAKTQNLGFSKANNIGIRAAKGRYVLLLNSDTVMKRGVLDELVDFAQNSPDAGVVAPRLLNSDGSTQASVFKLPTLSRTIRQYVLNEKGLLDKYAPKASTPTEVESVVGACFLITPRARKLAGILDERYFMYFEDLDYCRKVRKRGLKIYYLPNISVLHIHGASGQANEEQIRRLVGGSKLYHGAAKYYLITGIIWLGQKIRKLTSMI